MFQTILAGLCRQWTSHQAPLDSLKLLLFRDDSLKFNKESCVEA